MDLAIEANRNSALFNTMQQVLDVYNPLLHKARPTTVNETKQRINVSPTRWGTTMDTWSGNQSVRFDVPRIGSLVDFSIKMAFSLPGTVVPVTSPNKWERGRGFAKTSQKMGSITSNDNTITNDARGRLDRVYADNLFGFNMIKSYVVSSKSRRIFSGTGEYLLARFSQLDDDAKDAVVLATTPVDLLHPDIEQMYYEPGKTYNVSVPLFMFFNEHITHALDVNFSEEVHIDIELRSPSQLFWYGQLGDLNHVPLMQQIGNPLVADSQCYNGGDRPGIIAWDQGWDETAYGVPSIGGAVEKVMISETASIGLMQGILARHIQGFSPTMDSWGVEYGTLYGTTTSSPTFAFPDVNSDGESAKAQFQGNADFLIQDTDAYRALRAQMFPEGSGLTTITYDTAQEVYQNLMSSANPKEQAGTLLDVKAGGKFQDPANSATGLTVGDSSRYVDLNLRVNNLVFATHFMVRKQSDFGGSGNTSPGPATGTLPSLIGANATSNNLGARRVYTRCLPVHYFQILSAGRVIYESDAKSHLNLTQTGMYNGTGLSYGTDGLSLENKTYQSDKTTESARGFNIYSINHGLQASRIENSGCLSMQNLNAPTLRIYFKPETWGEYNPTNIVAGSGGASNVEVAAAMGVQVDVLHEFFNVVTINSGNGEITSGLNQ